MFCKEHTGYYTAQRYLDVVFFIHISRLLPLDQ